MEYRLTDAAFGDLAEIHSYIAHDSSEAARRFIGRLYDKFDFLARFPEEVSGGRSLPAAISESSARGTMLFITESVPVFWKSLVSSMVRAALSPCSKATIE